MRKLIKKILKEGEWDWLSDHEFDIDKVKVGDKFKVVGGDAWFKVDEIKWNETSPELSMVYIKNPNVGWENQFYIKDIIKALNRGQTYDPNGLEKIEDKEINESDDLDWIKDFEAKWDVSNIHLVAGKKFHFNPKKFLPHISERIYHFKDEINPQPLKGKGPFLPPRDIEICWETATTDFNPTSMSTRSGVNTFFGSSKPSGIKCGKNSIRRVIDMLNKGVWILLDDVIKESNELDWISDTGDNLNKIKVGATFRPTNQYDPTLVIKIHKVAIDEKEPMYKSSVYVRGLESDGNTFDTIYYLETFLEWLDNGDLELVADDFGDFGFPEELLNHPPLSESSELDWIKDIEPPSYDSLVGKALYFDPHISRPEQLKSVIKPLKIMGFHHDGTWVDDFIKYGVEDYEDDEIIGLYLRPDDGGITYTAWIDEDYEYHINEWAGEPVQVLDGWGVLQPII